MSTCKNGHDLEAGNLYVSPGGIRKCRACDKARAAAKRALVKRRASMGAERLRRLL